MSHQLFQQKVFIVTGASEGIGAALVLQLAQFGAKLVLAARDQNKLEQLKSKIIATSPLNENDVLIQATDVGVEQDCQQLIEQTINQFGQIDYLVNNAGITMWARFDELTDLSVFDKIFRTNLMGAVYCTHYALPHLKRQHGTIVAVASLAGLVGVPCRSAYAASKHAMIGFFDSLRIEQQENHIKVVVIAPDFVVSQIHKRAMDKDGNALGQSPMQEQKIMSSDQCARFMINAIKHNKRLAISSFRGKIGQYLKLLWPSLIDRLADKAIRQRH